MKNIIPYSKFSPLTSPLIPYYLILVRTPPRKDETSMKIITISREFGSGGRELGKRLADILGFDYYDREIITAITKNCGLNENYVENILENHGWQNVPITFHSTLNAPSYAQSDKVQLLLEQKHVLEEIAEMGKDCVVVGRNADLLLKKYQPLNLFVCSSKEAKIKRCMERTANGETLTEKDLLAQMKRIDKERAKTRELILGAPWGKKESYHLTINTAGMDIKELAPAIANFASRWFGRTS